MCRQAIIAVASVCGLLGGTASAQTMTVLTEAEALERMRTEHPQARALRFGVRELEANVRERTIVPNPTVSYTREDAGLSVDDFLLVTQELPLRGRTGLLGEAAGRAATAAQAAAEATSLSLATELRLAFTDLLVAQERIGIFEEGARTLTRLVHVLRAREAEGEGSRFDRLRAEREIAEVETEHDAAAIARLDAQARLAAFFAPGTDPGGLRAAGSVADTGAVPPLDPLLSGVLDRRADYRALVLEEARWDAERRAAERLRYPATTVSAGLKRAGPDGGRSNGYAVTASVAVPLFNHGQLQVVRAEAAQARVGAERDVLGARIASDVRVAHVAASRYRALTDRYRASSLEAADELLSIAGTAYEEGEYGILELLDTHRVALGARLRLLQLSATARKAAISLDRAVGGEALP